MAAVALMLTVMASGIVGGDSPGDAQGTPASEVAIRSAPYLRNPAVSPTSSQQYGTPFTYSINYTDFDNDAPTTARVYIDNVAKTMTGAGTNYRGGVTYTYTHTFPTATRDKPPVYRFEFINKDGTIRSPMVGDYNGPDVPLDESPKLSNPEMTPLTNPLFDMDYNNNPILYEFRVRYSEINNFGPAAAMPKLVLRDVVSKATIENKTMAQDVPTGNAFKTGYDYWTTLTLSKGSFDYYFVATRLQPTANIDKNLTIYCYNNQLAKVEPTVGNATRITVEGFPISPPAPKLAGADVYPKSGQTSDVFEFNVTFYGYVPVATATLYYKEEGDSNWQSTAMTAPLSRPGNDGSSVNGEEYVAFLDGGTDLTLGDYTFYCNFTDAKGRSVRTSDINYPMVYGSDSPVEVTFELREGSVKSLTTGTSKGHLGDIFRFTVVYQADNEPKIYKTDIYMAPKLVIDGNKKIEMKTNPNAANAAYRDLNFANGEEFYQELEGTEIDETGVVGHTFYFEASDGISPLNSTAVLAGPMFYPEVSASVSPAEGGPYEGFEYTVIYRDPDNDPARNVSLYIVENGSYTTPIFVIDFIDRYLMGSASCMHPDFILTSENPDHTKYFSGVTFSAMALKLNSQRSYGFYAMATDEVGADPDDPNDWTFSPGPSRKETTPGPIVQSTGETSALDILDLTVSREARATSQGTVYDTYVGFTVSNTGETDLGIITFQMELDGQQVYSTDPPKVPGGLKQGEELSQRIQLPSGASALLTPNKHQLKLSASTQPAKDTLGVNRFTIIERKDFETGPVIRIDTETIGPSSVLADHDLATVQVVVRNVGEVPENNDTVQVKMTVTVNGQAFAPVTQTLNATETSKLFEVPLTPPLTSLQPGQPLSVTFKYELTNAIADKNQKADQFEIGQVEAAIEVTETPEGTPSFAPALPAVLVMLFALAALGYQRAKGTGMAKVGARTLARRSARRDRAISPIIATILLVAITVVIIGVLYNWVFGFVPTGKVATPKAQPTVVYDEENDWYRVEIKDVTDAKDPGLASIRYELLDSEGAVQEESLTGFLSDEGVYGGIPARDAAIGFYDAHPADGYLSQGDIIYIRDDPNNGAIRGEYIRLVYEPTGDEIMKQILL